MGDADGGAGGVAAEFLQTKHNKDKVVVGGKEPRIGHISYALYGSINGSFEPYALTPRAQSDPGVARPQCGEDDSKRMHKRTLNSTA